MVKRSDTVIRQCRGRRRAQPMERAGRELVHQLLPALVLQTSSAFQAHLSASTKRACNVRAHGCSGRDVGDIVRASTHRALLKRAAR